MEHSESTGGSLKAPWREKFRRGWREYQWLVIGGLWLVALVLGFIGYRTYFITVGENRTFWDTLYRSLQLFVFESGAVDPPVNWALQVARYLAPMVAVFTAIQAFAAVFYEQFQRTGLKFTSDHVVVCGLGRKGLVLAREFHRLGYRVVVIEGDEENILLEQCRGEGVIVLIGDATDREMLAKARVQKARYLVSVCGNDSTNAEVAVNAGRLTADRKGRPLTCLTQIVDLDLCNLLREQEIFGGASHAFRLEFFNVFESGARALLDEFPVSGFSSSEKPPSPHVLVVGLGNMGRSLVMHAARRWQAAYTDGNPKLRFSIVDRNAQSVAALLTIQFPWIEDACDIVPLQMELESPDYRRAEFLFDSSGSPDISSIYICLDDDSRALSAALTLLQRTRGHGIPIVVRLGHEAGLASLVGYGGEYTELGYRDLHAFGLLDRTCRPDLLLWGTHEVLARAIHEEYLRAHREAGGTPSTNPSMVSWEELSDDLRESNLRQADDIGTKLTKIGCCLEPLAERRAVPFSLLPEEVGLLTKYEHERWCRERTESGWTWAPPPKNLEKKTNPLLVPWDELPADEKERARDNIRQLPEFLAKAGFQVARSRR